MDAYRKIQENYSWSTNVLMCLANPIWAIGVDKFGFRPIIIIISFLTFSLSIHFFFFLDKELIYVICIYCSTFLRSGVISSLVPHLMHIYGFQNYLILGGFGIVLTQFFTFGAASVSIIISIFKKTYEELIFPYRIVSLVGISFSILGLFLAVAENDDKFQFEGKEDEENKEIEKIKGKEETEEESNQIN